MNAAAALKEVEIQVSRSQYNVEVITEGIRSIEQRYCLKEELRKSSEAS